MKRVLILLGLWFSAGFVLSCGSSSSSSGGAIAKRAFVTQDISSGISFAGVLTIDAENDVLGLVAPLSAGSQPGMMVVTPNRSGTLVFSAQENLLTLINNSTGSSESSVALPGFTKSFVVAPDTITGYAAVPGAPVSGQPPGVVKAFNLASGAFTTEIDIPAATYLAMSHNGSRLLALSTGIDSVANRVAVITLNGAGNPTVTLVPGFDHPIAAFFSSDDTIAYVVNCGIECGGTRASVQQLNMTGNSLGVQTGVCTPGASPVCAASTALVSGTTMYLAGTPYNPDGTPAQPCTGQATAAPSCGLLTVLDLPTMTVTKSGIVITDGFHDRMAMGANGQLFVGANDCTEISVGSGNAEIRGCLSIYNTQTGAVVIPPANGDVTGIQPISGRLVVYVVQGGELQIYDTTTDKLQTTQINLTGEAVDVKSIDF